MNKMFLRYFLFSMLWAMLIIIFVNNRLTVTISDSYALREAKDSVFRALSRLEESESETAEMIEELKDDYLTRCRSFRYMAELDGTILESGSKLKEVMKLLNADELNVINKDGIITASTVDEYVGFDMRSTEQSSPFVDLFQDPEKEYTQDIMPKGADGQEFLYVGLVTADGEHVVQLGMRPERILDALGKNSLSGFISGSDGENKIYFIINTNTGRYDDHSDPSLIRTPIGKSTDFANLDEFYDKYSNGGYYEYIGKSYYLYVQKYKGKIIGVAFDDQTIKELMIKTRTVTILYVSLIFVVLTIIIMIVVNSRVVKRIHRIISDLDEIAAGNMEKSVEEKSLPEFESLSNGINHMKNSVISASGKISKIIEAMSVPIVVYEINYSTGECTVIGNIRKIFRLTEMEEKELLDDKDALMNFMSLIMTKPEKGEENVYFFDRKRCWVKIDEIPSDNEMFCVITDATEFIIEKRRIINERDRDALTGLYNRRCFERRVSELMAKRRMGVSAMLMIDLDSFKGINDTYGHAFGDDYLKFTADCLKCLAAPNVIVGRRSGDEFYIYFSEFADHWQVKSKIDELYRIIRSRFITAPDGRNICVPFSSGAAFLHDNITNYDDLLAEADEMLYKAKNENKGGFCTK